MLLCPWACAVFVLWYGEPASWCLCPTASLSCRKRLKWWFSRLLSARWSCHYEPGGKKTLQNILQDYTVTEVLWCISTRLWLYICSINNHQWSRKLLNIRFFSNLIKSILTHLVRLLAQLTGFLLLNDKGSVGWMNHMLPWTSPHTTKSGEKKNHTIRERDRSINQSLVFRQLMSYFH